MSARPVTASSTPEGLLQALECGPHALRSDEPSPEGADAGPAPTEYLALGLAACTTMTVKMYAVRHQWPLDRAEVTVEQQRQPEAHLFTRSLRLFGSLSEEQRQRLLEIANRCPVSRILQGKIVLVSELAKL